MIKSPIRKPVQALQAVSFEVGPGEICAVVGPNGAGKTTLFRILVGLTTPTSGFASVLGYDAVTQSVQIRRRLGWLPTDDASLLQRLSCGDNLRFHGRLKGLLGRELETAVQDALEVVGLREVARTAVLTLSSGMKARLRLARAIMHKPQVLILDEPTAAVDPVGAHGLLNLIVDIVRQGDLAALISSHRLDEIEALHSHVVLLNKGTLLFDGDLDDLRRDIDRPHLELAFGSQQGFLDARTHLAELEGVEVIRTIDNEIHVAVRRGVSLGPVLLRLENTLEDLLELRQVKVPLRDLLAEIYGTVKRDPE
ncbi:MAG: ABC transporter ATP-binding protein [Acidimicrobiia bacterium]